MPKPLRIAICEDTPEDADLLERFIKQSGFSCDCALFKDGGDFLSSFVYGKYDIVFMDIYLGDILGVEVVRHIREKDEHVPIAFTTTSPDHTLESYRLGALKYIEKPVTLKSVKEILELAELKRGTRTAFTHFPVGGKEEINLEDVIYFEQQKHSVIVHTAQGSVCPVRSVKLADIETRELPASFLRCHHSFIVNLRYVAGIDTKLSVFRMKNGDNAHIRRDDLKKSKDAYERFLFAAAREAHNEN